MGKGNKEQVSLPISQQDLEKAESLGGFDPRDVEKVGKSLGGLSCIDTDHLLRSTFHQSNHAKHKSGH